LKKLKDFNKYTLKQNEDIYSIYSKDILEEKDDVIKQLSFENIYSIESKGLQIISNHLIEGKKIEKIIINFYLIKIVFYIITKKKNTQYFIEILKEIKCLVFFRTIKKIN